MTFFLRRVFIAVSFFAVFGLALPQVPFMRHYVQPIIGVEDASAQTKKRRKSLFDVLFKRRAKKKNSQQRIKVISTRKKKRAKKNTVSKRLKRNTNKRITSRKKRNNVTKPKVVVVKAENAAKILVIGDYIGGDLARGLIKRYSDNANITVVRRTNDASGLARNKPIDWSEELPDLIDEIKPAAILALIGMNDRQKMRVEGKWQATLSEPWLAEYNARVEKITEIGKNSNLPLIWVGAPPVPFGKMNTDYLAFNEIYRTKVEAVSGTYVDIWDGYTNAEGKYVRAGPDVNGQIVRLRTQKGVSMTRAGRAKLAFFADIALRKVGIVQDAVDQKLASLGTLNTGITQPAAPEYNPIATGKTVIIPLGAPVSDGGDTLEGEKGFISDDKQKNSISYDLVDKGIVNLPQAGRIDSGWGAPVQPKEDEKKPLAKDTTKSQQSSNATSTETVVAN